MKAHAPAASFLPLNQFSAALRSLMVTPCDQGRGNILTLCGPGSSSASPSAPPLDSLHYSYGPGTLLAQWLKKFPDIQERAGSNPRAGKMKNSRQKK